MALDLPVVTAVPAEMPGVAPTVPMALASVAKGLARRRGAGYNAAMRLTATTTATIGLTRVITQPPER